MTLPEKNLGPPRQGEGAPIRKTGTPPELTVFNDHIRQGVDATPGPSPLHYAEKTCGSVMVAASGPPSVFSRATKIA